MKHNKAYKCRFYPTPTQENLLNNTFGCVRYVYNKILAWRQQEYADGKKMTYKDTSSKLTSLKKESEHQWLNNVSSVALQQVLRHKDTAYKNFFNKTAKFPNFKKKVNKQSCTLTNVAFRIKNKQLYIAKSDEALNIAMSYDFNGDIRSLTISKDCAGRYFISLSVEEEITPLPPTDKKIGIDLGLTHFAVTSDGEKFKPIKALTKYQQRLKYAQRKLAKKKTGSKNRVKARLKVAKIHNKITDSRQDFLHKLSSKLIHENQVICLESLKIANMVKNSKLAKHIADAAWGNFVRMLEYKAAWYGRTISKISTWYPSSQLCSTCGKRGKKQALHIRSWTCKSCTILHDRDVNASKNILTAGLVELLNQQYDCGASSVGS